MLVWACLMLKVGILLILMRMVVLVTSDNDTVEKDDAQAKLNLKIVDPSGDHSIYTLQFNRAAKTAKLLEMKAYNPAGYMIGGQTYDNTEIQIQEGSNLDHVYHLIW